MQTHSKLGTESYASSSPRRAQFFVYTCYPKMKNIFEIHGPCEIPVYKGAAARIITEENAEEFWKKYPNLKSMRGCYVFGMRASKGSTPFYAGLATKSFGKETFTHHKLTRYQQCLADYQKGTPILYFISLPTKRGSPNTTHMKALEKYLIELVQTANPELLNIKDTKEEEWGIAGVIRGGKGKRTQAATRFRSFMKLSNVS